MKKERFQPLSAPTPLSRVSRAPPAITAPATAPSTPHLAPREHTARTTGHFPRKTAVIVLPVRTARSLADRRTRTAAQARGRLNQGPNPLPLVKPARPARTPACPALPTSQHASLVMLARTRPSRAPPRRRRAKRVLRGSTALRRPRLRCRALPARSCPPRAPCLSTSAGVALWARTARVTPQRHPRCVRRALTSRPPARST